MFTIYDRVRATCEANRDFWITQLAEAVAAGDTARIEHCRTRRDHWIVRLFEVDYHVDKARARQPLVEEILAESPPERP